MRLHIVIPVLNCLDLTKQALGSIKASQGFTIHIMDQNSTDGTDEWAKQQADKPDFWHHRFTPKVSLSQAWNEGIKEALRDPDCEYIFIPNNDVVFHEKTIDNLVFAMDELGYAMVTGENVAPRMSLHQMHDKKDHGDWAHDSRPITSWLEQGPDFSCFMIKRDYVEKIGWFDENFPVYSEDCDAHIRMLRLGEVAKRITIAPYYHIASQTMAKNSNIAGEIHESHAFGLRYYREKWGADHAQALDNSGYQKPYNDQNKTPRFWRGVEKYHEYEMETFGKIVSV